MEKDLDSGTVYPVTITENNFDYFQKIAASTPVICYNGSTSQNDLGCRLQAKEGMLV